MKNWAMTKKRNFEGLASIFFLMKEKNFYGISPGAQSRYLALGPAPLVTPLTKLTLVKATAQLCPASSISWSTLYAYSEKSSSSMPCASFWLQPATQQLFYFFFFFKKPYQRRYNTLQTL